MNKTPKLIQLIFWLSLVTLLPSCFSSTASPDDSQLKIKQIYTVKPNVLALHIETGRTLYGRQMPYQFQIGDRFSEEKPKGHDWIKRGLHDLGALVGKDRSILFTFDRLIGTQLDTTHADQPTRYTIVSKDDPNYKTATQPESVFRKTKPIDMARINRKDYDWSLAHVLYLKLPTALVPGKTYRVSLRSDRTLNTSFHYQPQSTRSEAVHVSHIGFKPDDPAKVAFLSTWMGNGGGLKYSEGLTFWVIDERTHQKVYTGQTKLSKSRDEVEDARKRNYTLTDVYSLDFSDLTRPGTYRVCVTHIGCSFTFKINQDVWQEAFFTSTRGLYHQRSGIELGPPYTPVKRPRAFHPDDGVVVFQTTTSLMETNMGIGKKNAFQALTKTKQDQQVPTAWGGYFDAGDWDRRIQHLEAARLLLELGELFPDYFKRVNLNLPESNNQLPDIIDEALWGLDFFKRLQTHEGGIRGGIESAGHPLYGEASWQESQDVLAYAPDLWSSYIYAGVAARAALYLESQFPKLARDYRESALRAMEYAEKVHVAQRDKKLPRKVINERNLAAIELFRLTNDDRWHQIFLKTTAFDDPDQETYESQQRDAAFVYARIQNLDIDSTIQKNSVNALLREADMARSLSKRTAFKWTKMHPRHLIQWGSSLGTPKSMALLRAHFLTGETKYLRAGVLATQFSLGANPDNMTYTTGLGHRSPQHPLIIDQRVMGQSPPPGITVYGPIDPVQFGDYWMIKYHLNQVAFPPASQWPTVESYYDIYLFPPVTEFTIMQTIAPTTYTLGYLAARPR
jgi:endoglucanase